LPEYRSAVLQGTLSQLPVDWMEARVTVCLSTGKPSN